MIKPVTFSSSLVCALFAATASLLPLNILAQDAVDSGATPAQSISSRAAQRIAQRDSDNDGLSNDVERALGTNPYNADSNGNGIPDGDEYNQIYGTTNFKAFAEGDLDSPDEDGSEDDSDGIGATPTPTPSPVKNKASAKRPVCSRPNQKKCTQPVCTAKLKRLKVPCKLATCTAKLLRLKVPCKKAATGPTPVPTSQPTPTPTASPAPGNFDSNGNTTKFGIPAGVTGNITRGGPVWSGSCSRCHGSQKTNRTYQQINGAFSFPEMSSLHLSVQQVADLTAYLNRANK